MSDSNFDAKSELLQVLENSKEIESLVAGGVHNLHAGDSTLFPRIIYTELQNSDGDYFDNKPTSAEVFFQVSIFCDSETVSFQTKIAKEVDKIMKSIDYARYDSTDLYEKEDKIFHKPMRYRKKFIF